MPGSKVIVLLSTTAVFALFNAIPRHAVADEQSAAATATADIVVADFEQASWGDWKVEGTAFGDSPVAGPAQGQMPVSGVLGKGVANSFARGDEATGSLTSPPFQLQRDHLAFLIGGGRIPETLGIELLKEGSRIRFETGHESEGLKWQSWDVSELKGQEVQVRIFDNATGGWGHILIDHIVQTNESRRVITVGRLSEYRNSTDYYRERWRPQFHFTPEMNWMNDPNGLVFLDGEYHLFYQHNPHANDWGHMSWGHAVSTDLVHWKHLPIALHDEYGVMVFSGCAVVDKKNTSGFGIDGKPPMVAVYTGHSAGLQTQDLAYSNDRGRTWTKYAGNPVLDIGEADFRDPKVFWHAPSNRWIMVVSLATQKKLQFYGSSNLKNWTLLSEFGPAGVSDKPNWECPDLMELPIDNEPGKTAWLLEADMGSGSVAGGSGGEYFTGTFDGSEFTADSLKSEWVDYGRDFYAPVSWSNIPENDGRHLWIGWMNNWETALNPTSPWRSAMSVPRELSLRRINGKLQLCQKPIRELAALRESDSLIMDGLTVNQESKELPIQGQQMELVLEINPGTATEVGLRLLKGKEEETVLTWKKDASTLQLDRTRSGNVSFHPAFPGVHAGPLRLLPSGTIRLQILVDANSVEIFGNDGETVITELIFPSASSRTVEFFSKGGSAQIERGIAYPLKSAWKN